MIDDGQLEFDEEHHLYKLRGKPIPSVTRILKAAGCNHEWYTPETAARGNLVHDITQMYDLHFGNSPEDFDIDAVPEAVRGYIEAWIRFRNDTGCSMLMVETKVYNSALWYAGQFDRLIRWGSKDSLADIKSGVPDAWHPIQTAAYKMCVELPDIDRLAIYLSSKGTYKVVEHKNRQDSVTWSSMLAVANWRAKHVQGVSIYDD